MSNVNTHYDVLKVTRDAPPEVIRGAYKHLSQKYHPDRNPGDAESARIMTLLNSAYQVLSDPEKRKEHDGWIKRQESIENQRNSGPSSNSSSNPSSNPSSNSSSNSTSQSYSSTQNIREEFTDTHSNYTNASKPQKKKVSILLGLGIIFFPYIFAWVTLSPGYSKKAKVISFLWLFWYVGSLIFQE